MSCIPPDISGTHHTVRSQERQELRGDIGRRHALHFLPAERHGWDAVLCEPFQEIAAGTSGNSAVCMAGMWLITWVPHAHGMAITWVSHAHHVAITWCLMHIMAIMWCHVAITWVLKGKHVNAIYRVWCSLTTERQGKIRLHRMCGRYVGYNHMGVTCIPHGYRMGVKVESMWFCYIGYGILDNWTLRKTQATQQYVWYVCGLSHGCHMHITWLSYKCHMHFTWLSHGY